MVEKLVSVAGAVAEPLVGDKIRNKTAEIIDTKFTDPRLVTNIEEMLLKSFGNEPYYNNLTKFLERFHTIKNVLDMRRFFCKKILIQLFSHYGIIE